MTSASGAPRPWRIANGAIYDANDQIVGDGAIKEADNALIIEAVNAFDALRSHVIALGRPDLVGEPFANNGRVSIDLGEDARLDISIPAGETLDDNTLAALRKIGEETLLRMRAEPTS